MIHIRKISYDFTGSDGMVCMWDLDKILSAKLTLEEAAAERPIFRLDPMNEESGF